MNEKQTPIEMMLNGVKWEKLPEPKEKDGLYATYQGVLDIGGFRFHCYVLNNGQRIFDAHDVAKFFEVH